MNQTVKIDPAKMADSVIIKRTYGILDLKKYKDKIRKNIKIFQDAIAKEKTEMKRVDGMIKSLEDDIKQAKQIKLLKKKVI